MVSPNEYCTTLGAGPMMLGSVWGRLAGVEIEILDGEIPMRIEDFEAPLLFLFIPILVREELLQQR
jgi:hypothetical protein